jgi:hypothetical protein
MKRYYLGVDQAVHAKYWSLFRLAIWLGFKPSRKPSHEGLVVWLQWEGNCVRPPSGGWY